jgi:hypothetical protein
VYGAGWLFTQLKLLWVARLETCTARLIAYKAYAPFSTLVSVLAEGHLKAPPPSSISTAWFDFIAVLAGQKWLYLWGFATI